MKKWTVICSCSRRLKRHTGVASILKRSSILFPSRNVNLKKKKERRRKSVENKKKCSNVVTKRVCVCVIQAPARQLIAAKNIQSHMRADGVANQSPSWIMKCSIKLTLVRVSHPSDAHTHTHLAHAVARWRWAANGGLRIDVIKLRRPVVSG